MLLQLPLILDSMTKRGKKKAKIVDYDLDAKVVEVNAIDADGCGGACYESGGGGGGGDGGGGEGVGEWLGVIGLGEVWVRGGLSS